MNNHFNITTFTDNELIAIIRHENSRRGSSKNSNTQHDLKLMLELASRYEDLTIEFEVLNDEVERLRESSNDEDETVSARNPDFFVGDNDHGDSVPNIRRDADFEVKQGQFMPADTKPNFTSLDGFLAHMNSIASTLDAHSTLGLHGYAASSAIRMAIERLKEIR